MTCVLGTGSFQWAVLPSSLPFLSSLLHFGGSWHHLINFSPVLCVCLRAASHSFPSSIQSLLSALCFLSSTGAPCHSQSPLHPSSVSISTQILLHSVRSKSAPTCHSIIINHILIIIDRPGTSNFHTYYIHTPSTIYNTISSLSYTY